MKILSILICCLSLAWIRVIHASPALKIVGGLDVVRGECLYQVFLKSSNGYFCGGSVISAKWILTAAHCLTSKNADSVTVVAGVNSRYGKSFLEFPAKQFFIHENFTLDRYYDDIALIRVNRDLTFEGEIQPVFLPIKNLDNVGHQAVLTGWGRVEETIDSPMSLHKIQLKVIDNDKCRDMTHFNVADTQICTLTHPGEGTCFGDSGGPLVADGVQIGIVSFGKPCAQGRPDIYTRVYSYLHWMDGIMSRFNESVVKFSNNAEKLYI